MKARSYVREITIDKESGGWMNYENYGRKIIRLEMKFRENEREKGEMKIAMERWRGENPQKFYETWGKVIPTPARRKLLRDLRGDDER